MVKVVGIIQARLSSVRLPGKVMLDLKGKTVLERVINQVQKSSAIDEIYVATSSNAEDNIIENLVLKSGVNCYRGSLVNVYQRFKETILFSNADIVVRITADNPFTNPKLIDYGVEIIKGSLIDYIGFKKVPVGTGVEIFMRDPFLSFPLKKLSEHNLEHVTSYFYHNPDKFDIKWIETYFEKDLGNIHLTIDTLEDYVRMYNEFSHISTSNYV